MKRLLSGLLLVVCAGLLSGCYYDPGYSYVRGNGYAGPAYYGSTTVYGDGYYAVPYGYGYDGWYGGYGCCYAPGVTIGGVWYGGGWNRGHYRGGYRGSYRGGYHGTPRGNGWRGNAHAPANRGGAWGGGGHRDGGNHGGDHRRH